uniref:Ubiquitin recognition factor in ER-associated degradation protein 1-like n=1 Tax=Dermatophagoides pteronyssinus TaxID=6956 RepID=A0A6P6Y741_DERPT|nr:ubiquitin recognition factor in ER-associated degradation protein 1-like [Dermatophagoides pteronyssinus]
MFITSMQEYYNCYSFSFCNKDETEVGNKIILPATALTSLNYLHVPLPMTFQLSNPEKGLITHCGVLEFSSDKNDVAYVPSWMMRNLSLEEGGLILVSNVFLPQGTQIKIQPQQKEFIFSCDDPKTILELCLNRYTCLSQGDVFRVAYGDRTFDIAVLECKPEPAIRIVDADIAVDFAPPADYDEMRHDSRRV